MDGHAGKRHPRGEERCAGTRASGSHCSFTEKTGSAGILPAFVPFKRSAVRSRVSNAIAR
jgi:hypothetical protein